MRKQLKKTQTLVEKVKKNCVCFDGLCISIYLMSVYTYINVNIIVIVLYTRIHTSIKIIL